MEVTADAKEENIRDCGGCWEVEAPEARKVLVEPAGQLRLCVVVSELVLQQTGGRRQGRGLGPPVVSQEHQPVSWTLGLNWIHYSDGH